MNGVVIALVAIIALQWIGIILTLRGAKLDREAMLERWMQDRRDLLDRLQAPSFQEYTNKVIREKKAEQPAEEKQKPHEFIS